MKSFENQLVTQQPITHNVLQLLGGIREVKGKQDLFKRQSPQVLKNLIEIATIQSTEILIMRLVVISAFSTWLWRPYIPGKRYLLKSLCYIKPRL